MSTSRIDERIWLPDLNAVIDWGAVWDAGHVKYGSLATWWVQATEGVNYYRAEMPARHLPGKTAGFESRDLQRRTDDGQPFFPRQEGRTAIWMFPGNTTRALLMAEMMLQGYRVLVEVDDNYTVAPPMPGSQDWQPIRDRSPEDRSSYEVHRRIVSSKACHGVLVATPKLWEVYSQIKSDVWVCPNCIDPADWPTEELAHAPEGVLRIGWAGSLSHVYDIHEIIPALDWASRQKDVEVVILGQLRPGLVEHRLVPWTDSLEQYRRNVAELDVMLCPIRPSEWSDCKSDIKALEAAMGGAVPVVSKTEPFRPWWGTDAPCLVAETRKDWLRCVKSLVADREQTHKLASEARAWVLRNRSIETGIEAWREAVGADA